MGKDAKSRLKRQTVQTLAPAAPQRLLLPPFPTRLQMTPELWDKGQDENLEGLGSAVHQGTVLTGFPLPVTSSLVVGPSKGDDLRGALQGPPTRLTERDLCPS